MRWTPRVLSKNVKLATGLIFLTSIDSVTVPRELCLEIDKHCRMDAWEKCIHELQLEITRSDVKFSRSGLIACEQCIHEKRSRNCYDLVCFRRVRLMLRQCCTTRFLLLCWYGQGPTVTFIILSAFLAIYIFLFVSYTIAACSLMTKRSRTVSRQAVHNHNHEDLVTRYIGRCLNNAALSVPNATLVPSSNCISKRRRLEVSLVCWYFFTNSFLSFKRWQVTSLQTERIWRCRAVFRCIHQAATQLLKWYRFDYFCLALVLFTLFHNRKQMNSNCFLWIQESKTIFSIISHALTSR